MAGNSRDASLAIWPDELDGYNRAALAAYPAFLSMPERVRLERIRQARMLFDGQHQRFYLDERRTQFAYRQVRTLDGAIRTLYLPCNVLRLVSMKAADLLMGEPPLVASTSARHTDAMDALADRCNLHQVLYEAAVTASAESESFLEAVIYDGEVYIQQVDADEVFPVGRLLPDGQHAAYVRRQLENVGVADKPLWLMLETTYRPGAIERHVWQLADDGKKLKEVALDQWPAFRPHNGDKAAPQVSAVQSTGIDWNTMVWLPNLMLRRQACSDYDGGVVGLQDALNAKNSQLAVVLLKHSQPKLLLPEAQGVAGETARHSDEVFFSRAGDPEPKYLTWDAQLDAAMKDRTFALNQILVQTETSPVLLGLKEGAAPDAYRKVRLEAFNSLTKAARRAVYWTQGVRTILMVASMLEQTLPGVRYDLGDISVQLRDGIPADALDRATELATLRTSGLLSVRRGLEQLIGDPAGVEHEEAELAQERSAATPSVLFGEPGESDTEASGAEDAA